MKSFLYWTYEAREELMDIYLTIAADNLTAAVRWQADVEARIQLLEDYPRLGVRREDIAPRTRLLVAGMYLILYETQPDSDDGPIEEVQLISVVHGSRDLLRLF